MFAISEGPWAGVLAMAIFGFTGSLHCAGMCGAIAASSSRRGKIRDVFLYHFTRVVSYSIIGFILGFFSAILLGLFPNLQSMHTRYLSVILGCVVLLFAASEFYRLAGWGRPKPRSLSWFQRFRRYLPFSEPVILGIATALLPCGFLYAAFLQAAVLANPLYSGAGMLLFALATSPALGFGGVLFFWIQKRSPRLAPWVSVVALLLAGLVILFHSLWVKGHDHQIQEDPDAVPSHNEMHQH